MATSYADVDSEAMKIKIYFKVCLEREDLKSASLSEMLAVLEPENPVEYVTHWKSLSKSRPFGKVSKTGLHAVSPIKEVKEEKRGTIGFRYAKYAVTAGQAAVIVIEKYLKEDFSFWVGTRPGSAEAGKNYTHKF